MTMYRCVSCDDLDNSYANDAIICCPFVRVSMLNWWTGDDNTRLLKYLYYYWARSGALVQCHHETLH